MSTSLIIVIVVVLVILTIVEVIVLTSAAGKKKGQAKAQANASNLARKLLEDIEFNRRELAMPTGVTQLSLKLDTADALLSSAEFAEKASFQTLEAIKAYRTYISAVGASAMVQRTAGGAPLVMSRVLAEGGREKFEEMSRSAESAIQDYFSAGD